MFKNLTIYTLPPGWMPDEDATRGAARFLLRDTGAITRVERDESAIEDLRAECDKAERELQRIVDELRERLEVAA